MTAHLLNQTRRKPGTEEGPYQPPDPDQSSPLKHRREMLRRLRRSPLIGSNAMRVIESILDRIDPSDPNLMGWDSVQSVADRTGLSKRSVNFAFADLRDNDLLVRLSPKQLEAWLDEIGTSLGFSYPTNARRPSRFTVLLVGLPESVRQRAKQRANDRAKSGLSDVPEIARPTAQGFALRHPIGNSLQFESESENRQRDGSLDPGVQKTEISKPDPEELARLKLLASAGKGWASRFAQSKLKGLGFAASEPAAIVDSPAEPDEPLTPKMGPTPVEPGPVEPEATPAALADLKSLALKLSFPASATSPRLTSSTETAIPRPAKGVASLVLELKNAPAFKVASVARALQTHFRDTGNEVTERTYRKYLGFVNNGSFSAELVAGLILDASRPDVTKPANHLSQALAEEWSRVKNRPPEVRGKIPGGRPKPSSH